MPSRKLVVTSSPSRIRRWLYWIDNNTVKLLWGLGFTAAVIAVFKWRCDKYLYGLEKDMAKTRLMGRTLPLAKGCGQAMKLIFSVILLPVSRNTTTWLRSTWLKKVFPFDDLIPFHMIIGEVGFVLAWTHAILHVFDFMNASDPNRNALWNAAFPGTKQPTRWEIWLSVEGVTGIGMLTLFTIAFAFAAPWPRRSAWIRSTRLGKVLNNFNYFWYTHHLFAFFYLLMFFHPMPALPDERNEWGKSDAWLWAGVPVIVYLFERALRFYRQSTQNTRVLDVQLLEGKVVGLKLAKPKRFYYTPGMYVFINAPHLSLFEWHPFSLTSAPGDDFISVHIRSAGDWTTSLHDTIEQRLIESRCALEQYLVRNPGLAPILRAQWIDPDNTAKKKMDRAQSFFYKPPPIVFSQDGQKVHVEEDEDDLETDRKRTKRTKGTHVYFVLPLDHTPSDSPFKARGTPRYTDEQDPFETYAVPITYPTEEKERNDTGFVSGRASYRRTRLRQRGLTPISEAQHELPPASAMVGTLPRAESKLSTLFSGSLGRFFSSRKSEDKSTKATDFNKSTAETEFKALAKLKIHKTGVDASDLEQLERTLQDISPAAVAGLTPDLPDILVDGPYGAPTQEFESFKVLMLIGAGVGVTPFISVMRDVLNKFKKHRCPKCHTNIDMQDFDVERIYFHWMVRESGQAAWFEQLLDDVAEDDPRCILDLNVHITREKPPVGAPISLSLTRSLVGSAQVYTPSMYRLAVWCCLTQVVAPTPLDIEFGTGLQAKVHKHYGRPYWDETFARVRSSHQKSTIGVFYCGPPALAQELNRQCMRKSGFATKFRFHAEIFG
ncbi:hypothetical protein BSKO_07787 [Bryopsis sp. KO-2023]|nr:hypothetical protein BSKO_07787 [Bryopsis sp. KO-2023]